MLKTSLATIPIILLTGVLFSHQATAASFQHVLILSIDGLRQADITDPSLQPYLSNINGLRQTGITYNNAYTSIPSDSFPGVLSYLTGASPKTTGVYYDDSYSRTLTAPIAAGGNSSTTPGTEVELAENIDKNPLLLNGGGDYGKGSIDTNQLPQNCSSGTCQPVYPWQYNKVNTIFDVAHNAGLYTAYSDKHPAAYTIAEGPTGNAIDDFYSPEINASVAIVDGKLVDASTAPAGTILKTTTSDYQLTEAYDDLKVNAIINQIDGKNALGTTDTQVPNLFAMNFQAVSVAEKALNGGIPVAGSPSIPMIDAVNHTDASIGRILDELKNQGLFDSTLVILTAKHGQSPRIGTGTLVKNDILTNQLSASGITVAQQTADDVSLLWLNDPTQTAAANTSLNALLDLPTCGGNVQSGCNPGIAQILWGSSLVDAGFGSVSDRTPDLIIKLLPGFVFVGNPANPKKIAEHGGLNDDDTHVALILGSSGFDPLYRGVDINTSVKTTQIAVTALNALGLNANDLQGATAEATQALPVNVPEPSEIEGLLAVCGMVGLSSIGRRLRGK